jgi:hypothetical protein
MFTTDDGNVHNEDMTDNQLVLGNIASEGASIVLPTLFAANSQYALGHADEWATFVPPSR